jgi:hypothetical protein
VNGAGEKLLSRAAFSQNQNRNVTQSSFLRSSNSQPDGPALADDSFEPGDFVGTSRRQMLQINVRITQDLRNKIGNKVERYICLPRPALVRLKKSGEIPALAQQHPNRRHGGRAGTEVDTELIGTRRRDRF